MSKLFVKNFSVVPGPRYRDEGKHSGEEYREEYLEPEYIKQVGHGEKLIIDLDGTAGYGTSWLEEVFGGLARKYNKKDVQRTLEFISKEEPYLIEDIRGYIDDV